MARRVRNRVIPRESARNLARRVAPRVTPFSEGKSEANRRPKARLAASGASGSRLMGETPPASLTRYQSGTKSTSGVPGIKRPWTTRTSDPLIKSDSQRVEPNDTDALKPQQLELWPDPQ